MKNIAVPFLFTDSSFIPSPLSANQIPNSTHASHPSNPTKDPPAP
jgi:hypothetical protein